MTCRICSRRRMGFSLVELLAVVGIIALLIAILVPSLNAVRTSAKSTATQSTIQTVLQTGLEMFKADMVVGGAYPPSAPALLPKADGPHAVMPGSYPNPPFIGGASFLVWALAGADLLGTPGFRDLDGDVLWQDGVAYQKVPSNELATSLYAINGNTNQPAMPRSGPFVATESMKLPRWGSRRTKAGAVVNGFLIEKYGSADPLASPVFLDSFERPILYYRANAGARDPAATMLPKGTYVIEDNANITGNIDGGSASPWGLDLGSGVEHSLRYLEDAQNPKGKGSLMRLVQDPNVAAMPRAQRPESFILVSAGPDGLYGTADDVANVHINK